MMQTMSRDERHAFPAHLTDRDRSARFPVRGVQVHLLGVLQERVKARSPENTYLRGAHEEAPSFGEEPPEDGYQGQYVVELANDLRAELGDDAAPDDACEWGVRRIVEGLKTDLDRIGVHFDTWFSERTLHERETSLGAR